MLNRIGPGVYTIDLDRRIKTSACYLIIAYRKCSARGLKALIEHKRLAFASNETATANSDGTVGKIDTFTSRPTWIAECRFPRWCPYHPLLW